jgi:hypothetical protein
MKPKFKIEIKSFKTIHSLADSWTKKDLIKILELADFDADDSSSEQDLYDYLVMAFDELTPEEAAELVLNYVLGDKLNKNQIAEIALEMQEENLWEDLFKITSLLYYADNGKFPHPDAADLAFHIKATNHDAELVLKTLDEKLISRILAKGMTEHAVIFRLFHDNIEGGDWKEAKDIIWQYEAETIDSKNVEVELTTAIYWVKELKGVSTYDVEFDLK